MNRGVMYFFSRFRGIFFSMMLLVLLASCMDDDDNFVSEPVEVAYVSIYHAVPDAPAFDILVDDRTTSSAFRYTDHSGYLNFFTGMREFRFRAENAANALIDTTFSLENEKAYSLFAINRLDNIEALLVVDSAAAPATGKAMVRFIHLSPDAPAFEITEGDGTESMFEASFREATPFREVDAGSRVFHLKDPGTGEEILASDNVDIRPGGYYTVIVRGFQTPPQGNTNILALEVLD